MQASIPSPVRSAPAIEGAKRQFGTIKTSSFEDVVEYLFLRGIDKRILQDWKLPKICYETDAGLLFITRERDKASGLFGYCVRKQRVSGLIELAGRHNPHSSRKDAYAEIVRLHKQG